MKIGQNFTRIRLVLSETASFIHNCLEPPVLRYPTLFLSDHPQVHNHPLVAGGAVVGLKDLISHVDHPLSSALPQKDGDMIDTSHKVYLVRDLFLEDKDLSSPLTLLRFWSISEIRNKYSAGSLSKLGKLSA